MVKQLRVQFSGLGIPYLSNADAKGMPDTCESQWIRHLMNVRDISTTCLPHVDTQFCCMSNTWLDGVQDTGNLLAKREVQV